MIKSHDIEQVCLPLSTKSSYIGSATGYAADWKLDFKYFSQ